MVGTRLVNGLVHLEPLIGGHVLGRDGRGLEVAAPEALVVWRLGVPCRPDRRLDLPVRHEPLQAQQVLLLALVRLNEEGSLRLCLSLVVRLLHALGLILILFVPARRLDSAGRLAGGLLLDPLRLYLVGLGNKSALRGIYLLLILLLHDNLLHICLVLEHEVPILYLIGRRRATMRILLLLARFGQPGATQRLARWLQLLLEAALVLGAGEA